MQFDQKIIARQAQESGYVRDTFEKVYRLTNVLNNIQNDSLLKEKLALKGGTAINLMIFDLPRLSVDIDMDFVENLSKIEMLKKREQMNERLEKYMKADGYHLHPRSKSYYALDSFVYEYRNAGGMNDNIKIEINYMNRCHVLVPTKRKIHFPWAEKELAVLSLEPIEIYGSKIAALFNRAAARDLYDVYSMLEYDLFDENQYSLLRECAMFYCAIGSEKTINRFNFNSISSISQQHIKTDLIPVLRKGEWFDAEKAKKKVITELEIILKPSEKEVRFWTEFSNKKYCPELLFDDEDICKRLANHPMVSWKCL